MIKLGQDDVRRLNWYGLKRPVAKAMALPGVNALVHAVGKMFLAPEIAQRLPLARRNSIYKLHDGGKVILNDPLHDIVARDIHWGGSRPTSKAEIRKLRCIEELSKKATVFLDIGAYGGICAMIAARSNPDLVAITYEIVPENHLLIIRNLLTNDLADRVEAKLLAIGANQGRLKLPPSMGLASYASSISLGSEFADGINIAVSTLDQEMSGRVGSFLMKIDVEGYEDEVFKGASGFIKDQKPDIICEILPDAAAICRLIEERLKPLGYRFYCFEEAASVEREIKPDPVPRDWLFSSRSDVESYLVCGIKDGSSPK